MHNKERRAFYSLIVSHAQHIKHSHIPELADKELKKPVAPFDTCNFDMTSNTTWQTRTGYKILRAYLFTIATCI